MTKEAPITDVLVVPEAEQNPLLAEHRRAIASRVRVLKQKYKHNRVMFEGAKHEKLHFTRDGEGFRLATIELEGDKVESIITKARDEEDNELFNTLELQFSDFDVFITYGKEREASSSTPKAVATTEYEWAEAYYEKISDNGDLEMLDDQVISTLFDSSYGGELRYSAAEGTAHWKSGIDPLVRKAGDSGALALYSDPDSSPLILPLKLNLYDVVAKIDKLLGVQAS